MERRIYLWLCIDIDVLLNLHSNNTIEEETMAIKNLTGHWRHQDVIDDVLLLAEILRLNVLLCQLYRLYKIFHQNVD